MKFTNEIEYEVRAEARIATTRNSRLRFGQAVFNYLYQFYPELAEKIRGTEYDPFHNSFNVERMFNYFYSLNTPTCQRCGEKGKVVELKEGVAMIPITGVLHSAIQLESDIRDPKSTDYNGVTMTTVGSELGPCLKCPECGYSRA